MNEPAYDPGDYVRFTTLRLDLSDQMKAMLAPLADAGGGVRGVIGYFAPRGPRYGYVVKASASAGDTVDVWIPAEAILGRC